MAESRQLLPASLSPTGFVAAGEPADNSDLSYEPTADMPRHPVATMPTSGVVTVEIAEPLATAESDAIAPLPLLHPSLVKESLPPFGPMTAATSSTASKTDASIGPGTVLKGRYLLERQIGAGGTALVFRATDLHRLAAGSPDPHVAIKILRPEYRANSVAETRLKREFVRLEALSHPQVVKPLDLDQDALGWFVVLELLEGVSLASRLAHTSAHPLQPAEARKIIVACGLALHAAHSQGQLHLDFKPANVFLTQTEEIRILDLGAGHDAHTTAAPNALIVPQQATPAYASPEILAGLPPDVRDDVFSFGVVIHELLIGRRPGVVSASPAPRELTVRPPGLSSREWKLLARALGPQRDQRPGSIMELVIAFQPRKSWRAAGMALAFTCAAAAGFLLSRIITDATVPVVPAPLQVSAVPAMSIAALLDTSEKLELPGTETVLAPAEPDERVSTRPQAPATPLRPAVVISDQPEIVVTRPTSLAAIILRREAGEGPSRPLRIQWQTVAGSAVPDVDFTPGSGIVRFADNQDIAALYVSLPLRPEATGPRTFFVELRSDTNGAVVHESSVRIPVTIRDPGTEM